MKRRSTTIEFSSKANKDDFRRMKSVLSCVSNDPTRPVLHHVLVEAEEGSIQITATDGRRLRSDRFDIEASPGLYDIKANTARGIYLVKNRSRMKFPNHRQVIPSLKPKYAHQFTGRGSNFVLWAAASLGCRLNPALIAMRDDEEGTLYIQKKAPGLSPAVIRNETTTVVVMPTRCTDSWVREIEEMKAAA